MSTPRSLSIFVIILMGVVVCPAPLAQVVISGNETKIELTSGSAKLIESTEKDSLTILDFASFPPKVVHLMDIPNTVIGPPSNIAITPNGSLALIANSIEIDPNDRTKFLPHDEIHLLDLKATPPKIVGHVRAGKQPSGMSISSNGKLALVANRADGSVSVLQIDGRRVELTDTLKLGTPEENFSDVAIAPDGKLALVSSQKGGYLALLRGENGKWQNSGRKISVYGQPYRVVITSDGKLGLTAGTGFGNGRDNDAITIVDLTVDPPVATEHVTIGAVPESIEISPDGKVLAAVVMNGSNLAADHPAHGKNGNLEILQRERKSFRKVQSLSVGAIPEGVAFTSDGKYIVVQCHPARELWIFEMRRGRARDTGVRIKVPGMPSSLRAGGAK